MEDPLEIQLWLCLALPLHCQPEVSEKQGAVELYHPPVAATLCLQPAPRPLSPPSSEVSLLFPIRPCCLSLAFLRPGADLSPCSWPFQTLMGAVTCQPLDPGPSLCL